MHIKSNIVQSQPAPINLGKERIREIIWRKKINNKFLDILFDCCCQVHNNLVKIGYKGLPMPIAIYNKHNIGKLFEEKIQISIFIGPESDHWLCLSLTNSLTP